ncbi:MAG TPA: glycerol-3-phosphate 1-O-acyltransferase PlsY [Caldisericia bacterium]|jgi:glycerol-3-phosphate acyltransferase PlsY|nr:glycerol-3-phosphate 1-O-acyltransferase PlsY [Caldisericia bacterium]HXK51292.1 glycerol-3-phosphate 1-O-acyltransferase PlsY [Caldisericia bacterium]
MINTLHIIFLAIASYIYGSIPFGFIIAYLLHKIDIREKGSGNIGATNITRVLGLKWGILSFLLDTSKGILPFLIAIWLFPGMASMYRDILLVAVSLSIIGHDFSCFLGFTGGKGMSTLIGLVFVYDVSIALLMVVVWILVLMIWGYVSLASIVSVLSMILWFVLFKHGFWGILFAIFFSGLTLWQHRENIQRLLAGKEKVMLKKNFLGN